MNRATMPRRPKRRAELVRKAATVVLAVFAVAAPTAGDIGSCGQAVVELDPEKFFSEKGFIDCNQCATCGLLTEQCSAACDFDEVDTEFDENCFPLVHDGEVCLNALRAANCSDYGGFMSDDAPTIPTECNFCPLNERPATQEPDE